MALRVIGAGFGRTGTVSLHHALDSLGFGPCHHMRSVLAKPSSWKSWAAAQRGEKVSWDEIFAGWGSTVDWPSTTFWRELVEHYPEAKVILTVRSADSWYASMLSTLIPFWKRVRSEVTHPDLRAVFEINQKDLDGILDDPERAKAAFDKHNEEVKRTIPKDRLLVIEPGSGWDPLCAFLGVPVPKEPYPSTNSREELSKGLNELKSLEKWHEQLIAEAKE
jgi:hypothetical protein